MTKNTDFSQFNKPKENKFYNKLKVIQNNIHEHMNSVPKSEIFLPEWFKKFYPDLQVDFLKYFELLEIETFIEKYNSEYFEEKDIYENFRDYYLLKNPSKNERDFLKKLISELDHHINTIKNLSSERFKFNTNVTSKLQDISEKKYTELCENHEIIISQYPQFEIINLNLFSLILKNELESKGDRKEPDEISPKHSHVIRKLYLLGVFELLQDKAKKETHLTSNIICDALGLSKQNFDRGIRAMINNENKSMINNSELMNKAKNELSKSFDIKKLIDH